jgi:hypothetical protein
LINLTAASIASSVLRETFKVNLWLMGARSSVVVKALCYKPEGGGFDTR